MNTNPYRRGKRSKYRFSVHLPYILEKISNKRPLTRMEGSLVLPIYGKGLGMPPSVGKFKFTV